MRLILLHHQVSIHWHVESHGFTWSSKLWSSFTPTGNNGRCSCRKEHVLINFDQQKIKAGSFSAWRCTDATARNFPFSMLNKSRVQYIYRCVWIHHQPSQRRLEASLAFLPAEKTMRKEAHASRGRIIKGNHISKNPGLLELGCSGCRS